MNKTQDNTALTEASVASRLGGALVNANDVDVGVSRERARQRRLKMLAIWLLVPSAFFWWRILDGRPFNMLALPDMPSDPIIWLIPLLFVVLIGSFVVMHVGSGRSPHLVFRPEQIDVSLDDVVGLDTVVNEVVSTLNTFLGYATYQKRLGGRPRRGVLFEGPPGTGKTHMAKAMARHAGVPFLYVSATSFQSMFYGATARKIRSYFRQLRKAARREGGAIGFIEEIDAIGMRRNGLNSSELPTIARSCAHADTGGGIATDVNAHFGGPLAPLGSALGSISSRLGTARLGTEVNRYTSEGTGGVVNELLVQLQSFDTPPMSDRLWNALCSAANAFLPAHRQLHKRPPVYNNILVIAATNRADSLDPALLRPGRFDRRLEFEVPAKKARQELIAYFLGKKAHGPELDSEVYREQLAGQTFGYTPVMLESLFDESLVIALRNGRDELAWSDVQEARLTTEIGLKNPVEYTARERQVVATHEAGHATVAYLSGTRRLEVLSIIKRKGSLGLLAHGDIEEVYTRSKLEMQALVDIALGGMCAEELYFGEHGTGPASDLAYATRIECEIVGSCGMAGSLVSLAAVENSAFNDTNLVGRVLADPVARPEVDRLLSEAKTRVRGLLQHNQHLLEALRDALLERDELVGDEILAVLESAGSPVLDDLRIDSPLTPQE